VSEIKADQGWPLPTLHGIGGENLFQQFFVIRLPLSQVRHPDLVFWTRLLMGDHFAGEGVVRLGQDVEDAPHL
jgi:hypothetical protein